MSSKKDSSVELRGTVLAFNMSPKGHIDGALITTESGMAQVNFPKHRADTLARSMRVGAVVELNAELECSDNHPVYIASENGSEATGKILRLNYASHGDVNGYHLDDGTFVHVKPDDAEKYELGVGDRVKATGERRTGSDTAVLDAASVEKLRNWSGDEHAAL